MPMSHTMLVPRQTFSPLNVPGLGLWLDPSDNSSITMNSTTVAEVRDKSGNSNHATQTTALNQPTLGTLGLRQAVAWDSTTWLDLVGFSASSGETIFLVTSVNTDNTQIMVASGSGLGFRTNSNSTNIDYNGVIIGTGRILGGGRPTASLPNVICFRLGATGGSMFLMRTTSTGPLSGLSVGTATLNSRTIIFDRLRGHAGSCTGDVIRYNRELTLPEIDYIGKGLRRKYGM